MVGGRGLSTAENAYNVLFIAIDDLRPELGCYGVEAAQTPNLDRFADSAIVFDRHYVQVPTCGASRFALLTGRSPFHSGGSGNGASKLLEADFQGAAQTMPELFRRNGYKTACIGKISHSPDGRVFAYNGKGDGHEELPHAWDELPTPFGAWKRGWGTFFAYAGGEHREDGQGHRDLMQFTVEADTDLPDGLMAETAIEQLKKWKGERFFIGLGFYKPHLPFVAPKQDWDAFEGADIPDPPNAKKIASRHSHRAGEFYGYNATHEKSRPLGSDGLRNSRRAYLACVRYVDRQVSKVLDELKRLKLDKNTIVVIWGDHGWFLGDRQLWGKHSGLEEANRSVLMVRVPGAKPQATSALAETLDLYPTLIDYCQLTDTATRYPLDGRTMRPLIDGKVSSYREAALSYWKGDVSIRSKDYRLIVTKSGVRPELYALESGFTLGENVADAHPEVVSELLARIPTPR